MGSAAEQVLPDSKLLTRALTFNLVSGSVSRSGKPESRNLLDDKEVFKTNKIRTARYNAFTFLPLALMVQYTKLGNVFWSIQTVL